MKQNSYMILSNTCLVQDTWELILEGDTWEISAPGQFVNIRLDGFFLRRPISICDWNETQITLIYKTVGQGTKALSSKKAGQELDILCPLGNGYNLEKITEKPVLAGGGAGVPPMYGLAKRLLEKGTEPQVILGFNTKEEVC